jgi:signal transduction histidine kinase
LLHSLRFRLTLWNLTILAASLTIFGVGLSFSNQRRMWLDIERDLDMRSHRAANMGPPGPRAPGQFNPPDQPGDGNVPRGPGSANRPQAMGQGGFFRPPPGEGQYDPLGFLRRPQVYDREGHSIGPSASDPVFDPAARLEALKGHPVFTTVSIDGVRARVLTMPRFGPDGEVNGTIQVARDLQDYDTLWAAQLRTLFLMLPLALIAAGVGALFLTNRALKPVAEVTQAAKEISAQDLDRRLEVEGKDELSELATTFNGMIQRLDSSFKQLNSAYAELEHLYENQRRFTADASHELRTPLTRLRLATSSALESNADPRAALEVADQAAESMSKLVQQLLVLSRADAGSLGLQLRPADLRLIASNAIQMLPASASQRIETRFAEEPVNVCGDEDHLERVFLNLLENALRHTPETGKITVAVGLDGGGRAVASVSDTGEGIAPEHLAHVTERFYRVDTARARADGGSGLGLAICKSIVEAHGGSLRVDSELGKGTTVTLGLPAEISKKT